MNKLTDIATQLGLLIEYRRIHGRDGEYRNDLRVIRLRPGMTYRHERSVLAHELAHAVFGDVPSRFGPVNAKQERRADEWAALQLITHQAYREAEGLRGGHIPSIAHDLDVLPRTVEAYQRMLDRIGDTVYVDGRMGAGQYLQRVQVA